MNAHEASTRQARHRRLQSPVVHAPTTLTVRRAQEVSVDAWPILALLVKVIPFRAAFQVLSRAGVWMRLSAVNVTSASCQQSILPTGAVLLSVATFRVPEGLIFLILAQPELTRRLSAQSLKLLVSFAVQANLEIQRRRRRRIRLVHSAQQDSGRHVEHQHVPTAVRVSSHRHSSLQRAIHVCEDFTKKWRVQQAAPAVSAEK